MERGREKEREGEGGREGGRKEGGRGEREREREMGRGRKRERGGGRGSKKEGGRIFARASLTYERASSRPHTCMRVYTHTLRTNTRMHTHTFTHTHIRAFQCMQEGCGTSYGVGKSVEAKTTHRTRDGRIREAGLPAVPVLMKTASFRWRLCGVHMQYMYGLGVRSLH